MMTDLVENWKMTGSELEMNLTGRRKAEINTIVYLSKE